MRCKICGSKDMYILVDVQMNMPAAHYRNLQKSTLRDKNVLFLSANWLDAVYVCRSCGHRHAEREI